MRTLFLDGPPEGRSTLEDLLHSHGLDPRDWDVKAGSVRTSARLLKDGEKVSRFIKADLVPSARRLAFGVREALATLGRAQYQAGEKRAGKQVGVLAGTDVHVGARGNPGVAELYRDLTCQLWGVLGSPARTLLILGSDMVHFDKADGTTFKGTRLEDLALSYQEACAQSVAASLRVGEYLREQGAQVHFLVVPGNHDRTTSFHLGEIVRAHFRGDRGVTVDGGQAERKYWHRGKLLLGFHHGDKLSETSLGGLMATEQPEAWGRSRCREWFLGDRHTRGLTERDGVLIRRLPALSTRNSWAADQGYVQTWRGVEGYLYDEQDGFLLQGALAP